jgi:hypothetical protein
MFDVLFAAKNTMSLSVNVYKRDETGEMVIIEPGDASQELAGFEVFRTTFYGGKTAKSLGLRLLPTLAERDLYVEWEDLSRLKCEVELVLRNIDLFTNEATADSDVLRFRVQNIRDAIERAQEAHASVVIW